MTTALVRPVRRPQPRFDPFLFEYVEARGKGVRALPTTPSNVLITQGGPRSVRVPKKGHCFGTHAPDESAKLFKGVTKV
jgi:hypothetical protein